MDSWRVLDQAAESVADFLATLKRVSATTEAPRRAADAVHEIARQQQAAVVEARQRYRRARGREANRQARQRIDT